MLVSGSMLFARPSKVNVSGVKRSQVSHSATKVYRDW